MRLVASYALKISLTLFLSIPTKSYSQSDYSYILRDNNRYEGIISVNNSARDLELKSFTINSSFETVNENDDLYVLFYNPGFSQIYVRINEVIPINNYLMLPVNNKWETGWNKFDKWPANEVIIPKEINVSNLGGIGTMDKELLTTNTIVPLHISKQSDAPVMSSYKIRLLSRETFSIFRYQLIRSADHKLIIDRDIRKEFKAGIPITIVLNSTELEDGEYELQVSGKIKNENSGPERRYKFYHKGQIAY